MKIRSLVVSVFVILSTSIASAQPAWQPFITSLNSSTPVGAAFLNEQYGFVTLANNQVFRTTDGGKNWKQIRTPAPMLGMGQCYFHTPANIFLYGTYESTDSGTTWRTLWNPTVYRDQPLYILNDIFFDCRGRISADHAQNWSRSVLTAGECITGNLDKSIAIWGGSSSRGLVPGLYSTDGGLSWNVSQNAIEADYGYAFPFSLIYIRAGGDDTLPRPGASRIQRSTDGGATWNTVLGPAQRFGLDDGLWGDACIAYTQMKGNTYPGGVLRSTDLGASWTPIGGPSAGTDQRDDVPICGVTTRGSVCYAIDTWYDSDTIWKFTDRSVVTPLLSDARIYSNVGDTLVIDACDSALLRIQTFFSACDYMRIQSLTLDNFAGGSTKTIITPNKIIHTGAPDTSYLSIVPTTPGTYQATIHLHYCASDWTGVDTTFPLVIVVTAHPTELVIDHKDSLRFATQSLCGAGGLDTISLSAIGCLPLMIDSTILLSDSLTSLEVSISGIRKLRLKSTDGPKGIAVNFHPLKSGTKKASLVIYTSIGTFTIPIVANVLPDERAIVAATDTLRSPLCEVADGSIVLTNPTCRTISVDSLTLAAPFTVFPNQLPVQVQSGDSIRLRIRFTPTVRGPVSTQAMAHLSFYEPTATVTFDTLLTVMAVGFPGVSADSLSASMLQFDTLHLCESQARTITVYSTGCDSLSLGAITLSGDSDFVLQTQGTKSIAPGDSIVLTVSFVPNSVGLKFAVITVPLDSGGSISIPLTAASLRAVRRLTLDSVGTLTFDTSWVCEQQVKRVTLRNPSCDSVVISGVDWSSSSFRVLTPLPLTLLPGSVTELEIISEPDTNGHPADNRSVASFRTNSDSAIPPVPCIMGIRYPKQVHFWLETDPTPLTAGQLWTATLKTNPHELDNISAVDLTLDYNNDLLEYRGHNSLNTVVDSDGRNIHIENDSGLHIDSVNALATFTFGVYLTTAEQTSLSMRDVRFNGDDSIFTGCHAVAFTISATFNYQNECGHPTLRDYLRGIPPQLRIVPNPSSGSLGVISDSPLKGVQAKIVTVLGQVVFEGALRQLGPNQMTMPDGLVLAPGIYTVELRTDAGIVSSSQLVVRK
ncbi:MAG: choice-of-anchor D domain-containing protein [Bacteroidetes bacterium]|nr:choice-of-anchor D domain-containing protein [Bacteroidota bacterium]